MHPFMFMFFFFFLIIRRPPRSTLFPYHDALPIWKLPARLRKASPSTRLSMAYSASHSRPALRTSVSSTACRSRSEEHTSELQSRQYLVCRLLLEKKKQQIILSLMSLYLTLSSRES